MNHRVCIFLFSDALGYEIVQRNHFLTNEFPFRFPVRTQFGYSSTCVPTILTGESPEKHGHFSFFYRSSDHKTPFRLFRYLHPFLHPSAFFDHHRVRHQLSRLFAKSNGFTGYFNLYRVPYARLPFFDYCEKQDIFAENGLTPVKNLRDVLQEIGVPFHISNWHLSDTENMSAAKKLLEEENTGFFFIYTAGLDGFLHFHVHEPEAVASRLGEFAEQVRGLLRTAQAHSKIVEFCIISDHGMTSLKGTSDLKFLIERLPFRFGKDYLACYDSTMLRAWFMNPSAWDAVRCALTNVPGHWLSAEEKRIMHIDFADRRYGEEIFLMDPGYQIVPSDMGAKPIPGMHGFTPNDRDSTACILSNCELPERPLEIADFFRCMKSAAQSLRKDWEAVL